MSGGNATWAEDVTHDVFIRLLEKAPRLDRAAPVVGWLLTVAHGFCMDKMRRDHSWWHRVREGVTAEVETVAPPEHHRDHDDVLFAHLRAALAKLPHKERAVVAMKYLDGLRQTDVAAALGCSEGYVSKLLTHGLARLRAMGWEVDDV